MLVFPKMTGGNVVGPDSATDAHIPQFDGTSGKRIKDGLPLVTTLGSPGADTNVPSEKAVRAAIASGRGENHVTDPDCEINLPTIHGHTWDGDNRSSNVDAVASGLSTEQIHGGAKSAKWVRESADTSLWYVGWRGHSADMELIAGKFFTWSLWVYAPSDAPTLKARVECYDNAGNLLKTVDSTISVVSAQWQKLTVLIEVPTGTADSDFQVGYFATPSDTSVFYTDDFDLYVGASAGDASGPESAIDDDIATFSGTSGKLIQDGGKKIADLIPQSLATAANDFIAASGAGAFAKKTPGETRAILGMPRIIIGTYTGDGAATQEIYLEEGFCPHFVMVWTQSNDSNREPSMRCTDDIGTKQFNGQYATSSTSGIAALTANGFTVGLDGPIENNDSNLVYSYLALRTCP